MRWTTAEEARAAGEPVVEFGSPGDMRRRLVELVVSGEKTATASLLDEYPAWGEPLPVVGERYPVADDDGLITCIIETTRVEVVPIRQVTWEFAQAEGEGFSSVDNWRTRHEAYWRREIVPRVREFRGDHEWTITDDTMVVMEWFRVVERREG